MRVHGDVEPELHAEPIRPLRRELRKAVIAHLKAEPYKDEDGLFYIHSRGGRPVGIHAFSSTEMDSIRRRAGC